MRRLPETRSGGACAATIREIGMKEQ